MSDVKHDEESGLMQIEQEGRVSSLRYVKKGNVLDVVSTVVHPEDRGRGVAASLVTAFLAYVDEHKYSVIPSCSYVESYIKRKGREDLLP